MTPKSIVLAVALIMHPVCAFAQNSVPAADVGSPVVERNQLVVEKFYPRSSRLRGEEGTVRMTVAVNRQGRFDGCQVVRSSGYAALDQAGCDMMLAGATGGIRRGPDGRSVKYVLDGLVEWKLPEGAARPAVPPPFDVARSSSGEPVICRRQTKSGSNFIVEKVCLTRADWRRQEQYAQEQTHAMQTPKGPFGQ